MIFDSLMLNQIVREIREQAAGVRVGRVFLSAPQAALVEFRRRGPLAQLLLSWNTEHPRVYLTDDQVPARGLTSSFVDVLRRYLRGARLNQVEQVNFDRLLRLCFTNAEGLGPESFCTLVIEPMGRWANAVLLEVGGTIRECARHVPAQVNRYRQLLPGEPYLPPPGGEKLPLPQVSAQELEALAGANPARSLKKLLTNFQGGSPTLIAELAARSGLDPNVPPAAGSADWADKLVQALREILQESAQPGAWVYHPPGSPPFAYPVRLASQLAAAESRPSLSQALAQTATELIVGERLRQQQERLQAAVQRAQQQVARRAQAREQALQQAQNGNQWREYGEALLSNLQRIPRGATEVELPLYTAEGERLIKVPLHSPHPPQEIAQQYFAKYKKAQRAAQRLPRLLAADHREEQHLAELTEQIDWADGTELAELSDELLRRGYLKRRPKAPAPRGQHREFHRIIAPQGQALWYGKTGAQNDRLGRQAHPQDLWLHVRDGPGGHVVVRTSGHPETVAPETLALAARIAAGLSRQRTNLHVEVAHTLVKNVRKPRGTPPGFVLYDHYSTLAVEPLYPPPTGE